MNKHLLESLKILGPPLHSTNNNWMLENEWAGPVKTQEMPSFFSITHHGGKE